MKLLDRKALAVIVLFTIVETVALTAWLALLGIPVTTGLAAGSAAALVLFLGLLLEHVLAGISTKL
ncbi:MAG TPA: hypothetical protein VFE98_02975 [Candidatus Bathyarchaeia archaeon]|nr:hypothetical protein [Candidatus Bathyarchaeia archaeon]